MKCFFLTEIVFFLVFVNIFPKVHRLNTESSSINELRSGYVCNFDDTKGEIRCYETNIADPEWRKSIIIANPGEAYEACDLRPREGNFIGTFKKSEEAQKDDDNGTPNRDSDRACYVWRGKIKRRIIKRR